MQDEPVNEMLNSIEYDGLVHEIETQLELQPLNSLKPSPIQKLHWKQSNPKYNRNKTSLNIRKQPNPKSTLAWIMTFPNISKAVWWQ